MRKSLYCIAVAAICFILSISCEKEEGKGGTSSITGKVVIREYNTNFTTKIEEYYATDEDVFIIYGDEIVYGDKTSTNFDGTYRFEYLREGNYMVYAYSEDSANYPSLHEIPVIQHIKISGRKMDIIAPDIVILKH